MPFRTRAAVTGAVLATVTVLLCPAAAAARPGAAPAAPRAAAERSAPNWTAAPAPGGGARPSGRDRPYFYLEGGPGAVMNDRISLGNPTDRAVTVHLRGADVGSGTGGGDAAGRGSGSGAWVAFAAKEVRIPPRTRAGVPFTVTVPRDAVPGDHPGALVATRTGPGGGERRVRMHLRVSGPTLSAVTVENVSVGRRGSAAVIRYTLVNRGNTVLAPRLAVRADGVFGPVLRRAARALPVELLPGRRVQRTETWPDPPGLDAVDVRLDVSAAGAATSSGSAPYTAVPWGLFVAGALVLAAGGGGGWLWLRRRTATPAVRSQDEGGAEVAEDERELASTGSGARA
ncbi:hypothetical protein ACIQNI_22405 [Streptomyces sp. NPDC091266]|uniref:COG1470 family protein n=1 Tax=Streptomyces sp. NPDC091266 TaxID=3365978 RepID=UPI0037FD53E0